MPEVVHAMPSYGGGVHLGVAAAFFDKSRRDVVKKFGVGSLLCRNFNEAWCHALNSRPVSWFVMQHDDIGPTQPGWLDTLIDEAESGGFDVLSVAMPLKDSRGLSSCGLGDSGDPWKPTCRFTMTELARMPETFTAADIGHPDKALLVNTGLWCCRFDSPWVEAVCFTIRDAIGLGDDGKFTAMVEPEDWGFSRWAAKRGLRIGVTRKVKANHYGQASYANDGVWGEPYDRALLTESLVL